MRKRRIDKRGLLRRVKELEEENASLRGRGSGGESGRADADTPIICGRGYPMRAPAYRAKSLSEAKRIITSGDRR
ncbi:MAG TPA: hypothetical protein H9692_04400 [Firmicutes bacterium]|nr:hypothetical protein [Bacillota bacterium]